MMQHVRSIPENLAATDQQLHELYTASEVCQLSILELEERSQHLEAKNTEHSTLLEDMGSRLAAAEHGIDALPPWKRAYEQKMLEREEDAKAKYRKLEDKDEELQSLVEQHMARMMERLPAICFLLELCAAAGSHSYMVRVEGNRDGEFRMQLRQQNRFKGTHRNCEKDHDGYAPLLGARCVQNSGAAPDRKAPVLGVCQSPFDMDPEVLYAFSF
jgi:hypothetical protein